MKKQLFWIITLVLVGNMVSLFANYKGVNLTQPLIWVLGSIWFILFLVYGLMPVIANLSEERKC